MSNKYLNKVANAKIGLAAGALTGAMAGSKYKKDASDSEQLRNVLTGAISGGALGMGAGKLVTKLTSLKKPTGPITKQAGQVGDLGAILNSYSEGNRVIKADSDRRALPATLAGVISGGPITGVLAGSIASSIIDRTKTDEYDANAVSHAGRVLGWAGLDGANLGPYTAEATLREAKEAFTPEVNGRYLARRLGAFGLGTGAAVAIGTQVAKQSIGINPIVAAILATGIGLGSGLAAHSASMSLGKNWIKTRQDEIDAKQNEEVNKYLEYLKNR